MNPCGVICDTQKTLEAYHNQQVSNRLDPIEHRNAQIRSLTEFLQTINNTRDAESLEFNTPDKITIVDHVREMFPKLIEPNTYSWNSKLDIDNLVNGVDQEIRNLSGLNNTDTPYLTEALGDRKKMTEEMTKLLEAFIAFMKRVAEKSNNHV